MSESEFILCNQMLNSFVLLIEGNNDDESMVYTVQTHLSECPDCAAEFAHEQKMHGLIQDVLRRTCCETAPEELHNAIYQQIHAHMGGGYTSEVVTEFTMTEISIAIDEFGNIEHREVTIEHTEEIRYENGEE
ncbi:MAG: hypothetical protein WCJ16_01545 [Actinomycetes bacterium]|jgi:hypothetical protein